MDAPDMLRPLLPASARVPALRSSTSTHILVDFRTKKDGGPSEKKEAGNTSSNEGVHSALYQK